MTRAFVVLAFVTACSDAPPPSMSEALPPSGLPATTEELLFGSPTRCDAPSECVSGACVFGTCAGLVTVDEPWLSAAVGERLRQQIARIPGLAERLVPLFSAMTMDEEAGLPFRGRAARALSEIGTPEAIAELERRSRDASGSLGELMAVLLASHDNPAGLDVVIELTRSKTTARAIEALRALGGLKTPGVAHELALTELLASLSPDIHLEESRAALDGLARLGDPRALVPLRRFLVAGPDGLAHETARAMRVLAGDAGMLGGDTQAKDTAAARLGVDPRRWDELFSRHAPPAPPPYTPRRHESEDDLDLPTP